MTIRPHVLDPLTRLAIRHGSDKWGMHFYTPVYHRVLAHLRDRPIRLLEIGVGGFDSITIGGASLAMWAEYFPLARITGIDIAEKDLALDPRITVLRGSQDDAGFLRRVVAEHGPFDVIIDDGSHMPHHVFASFDTLFPTLVDGGLYFIEDIQTAFWHAWGGDPETGSQTMQLARLILTAMQHAEIRVEDPERPFPNLATSVRSFQCFHNIFVIEKGDNTEPSNYDFDLANPHAARAMAAMEEELREHPTAAGFANLADTLRVGRAMTQAWGIVHQALDRWPLHPRLLLAAFDLAREANDGALQAQYLRLLLAGEPGNASYRQLLKVLESGQP